MAAPGGTAALGGIVAARPLLVVVEPAFETSDAAAAASRLALAAEASRLAAALGVQTRFVTWPAEPEVDFDSLAGAVAGAVKAADPVAVLVQDSDAGRQLAPLIARRLGTAAVLGCSDATVEGGKSVAAGGEGKAGSESASDSLTFVKPVYGGWLEQDVASAPGFVPVATLDLTGIETSDAAAEAAAEMLAQAEVVHVAAESFPPVRHVETIPPDARSVDLVHAKRIVAAGMGSVSETLLGAVHELADLLEGSVGATRPVVDEGHLPKERLIGQTGRTVAPDLYVALGISGSPHHVAGVRKADRVLSINRDVRAPIFQFSDVGYVADLEAVLPALIAKITEWRDAPPGGVDGR
jgi:electron transfer flavoprotein alpha subunit